MGRQRLIIVFIIVCFCFGATFAQSNRNLLSDKLNGQWVNTSLFDSTSIKRKLSPWINEFYGTAALQISRDSIMLFGCMDGGPLEKIKIINELSFTAGDLSFAPRFDYVKNSDLIMMTTNDDFLKIVFRRVKPTDRLDIITNEQKFEDYFKSLFFSKYLNTDNTLKVDKLWIGFETHTPFEFDAFAVRSKNGALQYFGWELTDKTLSIFQTTRNIDNDSGFYYWTKGKLDREINLK